MTVRSLMNLDGNFEIRAGPDGHGAVATLRFVP